jgi:hypothetical protein
MVSCLQGQNERTTRRMCITRQLYDVWVWEEEAEKAVSCFEQKEIYLTFQLSILFCTLRSMISRRYSEYPTISNINWPNSLNSVGPCWGCSLTLNDSKIYAEVAATSVHPDKRFHRALENTTFVGISITTSKWLKLLMVIDSDWTRNGEDFEITVEFSILQIMGKSFLVASTRANCNFWSTSNADSWNRYVLPWGDLLFAKAVSIINIGNCLGNPTLSNVLHIRETKNKTRNCLA